MLKISNDQNEQIDENYVRQIVTRITKINQTEIEVVYTDLEQFKSKLCLILHSAKIYNIQNILRVYEALMKNKFTFNLPNDFMLHISRESYNEHYRVSELIHFICTQFYYLLVDDEDNIELIRNKEFI